MDNFVPQPIAGAISGWMEQFHQAFDPSAILGDSARHAFYDNDNDADPPSPGGAGGSSSPNSSTSKKKPRMGPPQPDPDVGGSRGTTSSRPSSPSGNGGDAIAKSRAMLTANRIKNHRLQMGKARSLILSSSSSRPTSLASSTPVGSSPASSRRGISNASSLGTSYDSMESADVYLSDREDDFDDDTGATIVNSAIATSNKKKKKQVVVKGPAAAAIAGSSPSQLLLSKAAAAFVAAGCGSGGSSTGGTPTDTDDDERREGGGTTASVLNRSVSTDPLCGSALLGDNAASSSSSERESAPPPPSTNSPVAVIDLSSYDPHGPYDHLLERVAVMTIQMEKMRDEFDKMRSENATLLENLAMAGDAAAHLNLMDASEDENEDDDEEEDVVELEDNQMGMTNYENDDIGMEEPEDDYPVVNRRLVSVRLWATFAASDSVKSSSDGGRQGDVARIGEDWARR